jgi:DNA-binding CsgD family transcriptional regulator
VNQIIVGDDGSGRTFALRRLINELSSSLIDLSPRPGERSAPFKVIQRALGRSADQPLSPGDVARELSGFETVVIDDAHDLDDATASALVELASGDTTFIVARRPRLTSRALGELDEAIGRAAETTTLAPMNEGEVARSFGVDNPAGLVEQTGGRAGLIGLIVADPTLATLDSRVQRRIAQLDAVTLEVLHVLAAVHPGQLDDELIAQLAHTDASGVASGLTALGQFGALNAAASQLIPIVAERTLAQLDAAQRRALHRRLAADLSKSPASDPVIVAAQWRDSGSIRPETGAAFIAAGRATATSRPAEALEWFGLALEADTSSADVWFDHSAAALALGIDLAAEPEGIDRARADVLRARRSAQLGQWPKATDQLRNAAASGAELLIPALIIGGDLAEATAMRNAQPPHPTTPSATFDAACVAAVIEGSATLELADAARAVRRAGATVIDVPEVLAALALSVTSPGEVWTEALADRQAATPGRPMLAAERQVLLADAFLRVRRGDSAAGMSLVGTIADTEVRGRDAALLAAIHAALARRAVRPELQRAAFHRADEVRRWVVADPFSIEVTEELLIAAARIGDTVWVDAGLAQLRALAGQLGEQSSWRAQIGWTMAQVAITTLDGELLAEADRVVTELPWLPHTKPLAFGLAIRCWTDVVQRARVDPATAQRAADALESIGLRFEASQLLGQAALDIPASDPGVRELLGRAQEIVHPTDRTPPPPSDDDDDSPSLLSAREEEVAELKFLGHKNQVIAERLFIGVKTVETYVTRINAKFNAANRAEFVELYGKYRTRSRQTIT